MAAPAHTHLKLNGLGGLVAAQLGGEAQGKDG
jgi:hypothetical protein